MEPTNEQPQKAIALIRGRGPESIFRPQYKKWAAQLVDGKPLRVVTTHERAICFIPSAVFPENGSMPEGTLIVAYGGSLYQGYVELDFTKSPNPYFLKSKGFPLNIAVLICQTVYGMFPHLNPLSEEDIATLQGSKNPNRTTKVLKLTAPKKRKPRKSPKPKTNENPEKSEKQPEKVEHAFTEAPAPEAPEPQTIQAEQTNSDHATNPTKQPKARRTKSSSTRTKTRRSARKTRSTREAKRANVPG